MLEIFMYPVSGIMKLWHMLTQSFVNDSLAWLITIVLLVLTVRTLVAPLNWVSVRSGRIGALLRPRIVKFDEREQAAETPKEMADILREKNALFKEYNYRPLVGCLPIFITLPVLIGLYQLLIRMARTDMPDNYGLLNDEEVAAFRATIFQDIPITDFAKDHTDLVIPLLVAALLFTVATSAISVYRSYLTMQFDKKVNRRVFWFTLALLFLIPILLWNIAFSGPIPVASFSTGVVRTSTRCCRPLPSRSFCASATHCPKKSTSCAANPSASGAPRLSQKRRPPKSARRYLACAWMPTRSCARKRKITLTRSPNRTPIRTRARELKST
ncbi:YidC/Oxa1 family membrane protein insertase [Corynebacterium camporealensis]|uniref:YidC/Oxa1 family membrane protein insertase n=1 Tax=Corynebacterium camporealensis TaxID=161896 RepID=UPI0020125BCE|nr:YidC/Oxa1 family membrane protein insertase [Corynebacterium camporealensis]